MSDLPAYPAGQPQWDQNPSSWHAAQAAAALARLRVAVELLQRIAGDDDHYTNHYGVEAVQALAAIGPLP